MFLASGARPVAAAKQPAAVGAGLARLRGKNSTSRANSVRFQRMFRDIRHRGSNHFAATTTHRIFG
ncbi:MAG TPA: hypothetical protein VHM90_16150 [Phycisphaerae bacterium]|nr:hypothetical protein [Phycisphaerae bacterium]